MAVENKVWLALPWWGGKRVGSGQIWAVNKIKGELTWVVNKMNCTKPESLRTSYQQQVLSPANVLRVSINAWGIGPPCHLTSVQPSLQDSDWSYSPVNWLPPPGMVSALLDFLAPYPRGSDPSKEIRIHGRGANITMVFFLVLSFPS